MHRTTNRKPDPRFNGIRRIFFGSMACLLLTLLALQYAGRITPAALAAGEEQASFAPVVRASNPMPTEATAGKDSAQTAVNAPEITADEYGRIEPGMTQAEVMAIVGNDGQMLAASGTGSGRMMMRLYRGADTSRATVTFINGMVTRKAQLGLRQ